MTPEQDEALKSVGIGREWAIYTTPPRSGEDVNSREFALSSRFPARAGGLPVAKVWDRHIESKRLLTARRMIVAARCLITPETT